MACPGQKNKNKKKIMRTMYHNFKWVKQIKIRTIHFYSHIQAQNIDVNWERKTDIMKRTMKLWSRRNLSIHGKILIAKHSLSRSSYKPCNR